MPRLLYGLLLIFTLTLFAGCVRPAPELSTYIKPEVDFSQFKSYRWQEERPETKIMQAQSDIMHRLIIQTINEELLADGLALKFDADLTVTYRLTVSPQKSFWQTFFGAESVTPGTYNLRSAEAQSSAVDERKLKQGVLIIELRDRAGNLVWSGRASAIVSKAEPGRAVEAIRKIMEDYPPVSKP